MSRPKQHHYLPAQAYLRHFSAPERRGFVYQYARGQTPVMSSVKKLAREQHLYSFVDEYGEQNVQIEEQFLARLDEDAQPILEKLNNGGDKVVLSTQDYGVLLEFIAFLLVRTPSFRDQMNEMSGEMQRLVTIWQARTRPTLFLEHARAAANEAGIAVNETELDELRQFFASGEYDVGQKDSAWTIGLVLEIGAKSARVLQDKSPVLLTTKNQQSFITSDHPVCRLPLPGGDIPTGLLDASLIIPVGNSMLFQLENEQSEPRPQANTRVIPIRQIRAHEARRLNSVIIQQAERFLFSSENNQHIQQAFDQTEPPSRFTVEALASQDSVTIVASSRVTPSRTKTPKKI